MIILWDDMVGEDVAEAKEAAVTEEKNIQSRSTCEIDQKVSAVGNAVSVILRTWRNVRTNGGVNRNHEIMEGGQNFLVQKAARLVGLRSHDDKWLKERCKNGPRARFKPYSVVFPFHPLGNTSPRTIKALGFASSTLTDSMSYLWGQQVAATELCVTLLESRGETKRGR